MSLKTHRTKETPCLNCGAALDAATAYPGQRDAPTPGSLTFCLYCGHLMIFADDLSFRHLTEAEMIDVADDERVIRLRTAWAALRR